MNSLPLLPRRIFAFVARDFRLYVSYRMQFFLRIISVLAVVTTLFFISKIFAGFTDPQYSGAIHSPRGSPVSPSSTTS